MSHKHRPSPESREIVERATSLGFSEEAISSILGLSYKTLRKYYKKQLATGLETANLAVGRKLYDLCMQGDRGAILFWMKHRAGWKDEVASVNVSATANAGIILKVPMPIAEDEWNRLAQEHQAKAMGLQRTLRESLDANPVNNAMRPAMPEPGAERIVPLDEGQPGEVVKLTPRKPRQVRVLSSLPD